MIIKVENNKVTDKLVGDLSFLNAIQNENNEYYFIEDGVTAEIGYNFFQGALSPSVPETVLQESKIVTQEEKQEIATELVQKILDDKAKEYGYDNILSACSYAAHTNPFQLEGQKFLTWRGNVWVAAYSILEAIISGTRTEPTEPEFISELPQFTP